MKSLFRSDWGPAFLRAARTLAIMAAVLIVSAEAVYRAGLFTGQAVHRLSDYLAGLASGRIDRAATLRAVVSWAHAVLASPAPAVAPAPAPAVAMACAAVLPAPAAGITSPPLDSLPVRELRKIARTRGLSTLARKGRRADLLAVLA